MGLKCNLLSFHCSDFCAYIFRVKKVKKKKENPVDWEMWATDAS